MFDAAFDPLAHKYDAWFDAPEKRPIFDAEVACLRHLVPTAVRPWLEVGVGTGRFADALGVDHGLDPSLVALQMTRRYGVSACCGVAEALPYADRSCGLVLMVVTLCFLSDPPPALAECVRVLADAGSLIVGIVPADSPLGQLYMHKSQEGHPYYSIAKFYTCRQVTQMAADAGLSLEAAASCLFGPPEMPATDTAAFVEGLVPGAGFAAMRFIRNNASAPSQRSG